MIIKIKCYKEFVFDDDFDKILGCKKLTSKQAKELCKEAIDDGVSSEDFEWEIIKQKDNI